MLGRVIPSITQLEVFIVDVIIRNQDIKKLETTCFGLTLAIIRFHLEKLFCKSVIQLRNKIKIDGIFWHSRKLSHQLTDLGFTIRSL